MAAKKYSPTPHLLAFVDALGFSKEVKRGPAVAMDEYLSLIERSKSAWHSENATNLKTQVIGDSAVFAIECPGACSKDVLYPNDRQLFLDVLSNLAIAVSMFQMGLAKKNIWARGAITYDYLHFSEGVIAGPAFHRAYFLENKIAKFPRVIIDSQVVAAAKATTAQAFIQNLHSVSKYPVLFDLSTPPFTPGNAGVNRASVRGDVLTFIDYLAFDHSQNAQVVQDFRLVADHLNTRLKEDVEHFAKHRWTADYFIYFCSYYLKVDQKSYLNNSLQLLLES